MKQIYAKLAIKQDLSENLLKTAYDSIVEGFNYSTSEFIKDPMQFDFRSAKSVFINSTIKKKFKIAFANSPELQTKIINLKSHGMDYYLVDGKFLLVFKKMDKKGRVSSFYSKRFQETLEGNKIRYSTKMLNNLAEMGIMKPLPVFFVGHVISSVGTLEDVCIVNYEKSQVETFLSLKNHFTPNLFNLVNSDTNEIKNNEPLVKLKSANKRAANQ